MSRIRPKLVTLLEQTNTQSTAAKAIQITNSVTAFCVEVRGSASGLGTAPWVACKSESRTWDDLLIGGGFRRTS